MSKIDHTYASGGDVSEEWGTHRVPKRIREKITFSASAREAFAQTLPPRCKAIWWQTKNHSALTLAGSDATGTPDSIAILATDVTGTVSVSTSAYFFHANTASNGITRNAATSGNAIVTNTGTSEVTMYAQPADSGGSQYFDRVSATPTNGYNVTSGDLCLAVDIEQFEDIPDA